MGDMEGSSTTAFYPGRSIIVPSVQELAKEPFLTIPHRYARTDQDPPLVSGVVPVSQPVPVIDVGSLVHGGEPAELEKLHLACKEWGFFQVVNHGVSTSLVEEFKLEAENLFNLPYEEKKKMWQRSDSIQGFGQRFVVSDEQQLDWSDVFGMMILPVSLRRADLYEKLPQNLRDKLEAYSSEMKRLALSILEHMAKALKMDTEEIKEMFTDGSQAMRMNYYPPCPEPELAIGLSPHSDVSALTILLQVNETEGLQIRKDGKWVPVTPLHNAFIVNVGDVMEVVSNGMYRSIEHRATVNSTTSRLSIATFYSCKLGTVLEPSPSLIAEDKPPIFQRVPLEIFLKNYFDRKLDGKSNLDFMRLRDAS